MAYPFVQARYDYGPRNALVHGFVVHMAEGGGTVGFLAGNPARGVSVHYVIESSGRIVQMLREDHASGSINPAEIRETDDADGFYGRTAAVSVLGSWADDPNVVVISVEIEGFAANGPNAAQHGSLRTLVADVRTRYPGIGLLGHRDFADYKACPGKLIHWEDLGGHGMEDDEMAEYVVPLAPASFTINGDARSFGAAPPYTELGPISGTVTVDGTVYIAATTTPHGPLVRVVTGATGRRLIAAASGTFGSAPPVVDCTDVVTRELDAAAVRASDAVKARP
jgi:N-acetylmuramoyl-L-alanine amidase-like protein